MKIESYRLGFSCAGGAEAAGPPFSTPPHMPPKKLEGGSMTGGKASRRKGDRFERECVALFQTHGIAAERVPLSGAAGGSFSGDVTVPILGIDRRLEAKIRRGGFK